MTGPHLGETGRGCKQHEWVCCCCVLRVVSVVVCVRKCAKRARSFWFGQGRRGNRDRRNNRTLGGRPSKLPFAHRAASGLQPASRAEIARRDSFFPSSRVGGCYSGVQPVRAVGPLVRLLSDRGAVNPRIWRSTPKAAPPAYGSSEETRPHCGFVVLKELFLRRGHSREGGCDNADDPSHEPDPDPGCDSSSTSASKR